MASQAESALERGREWLESVLQLMSVSVPVVQSEDMLEIEAADLLDSEKQALLGEGGATLDALQYLANALLNLHLPKDAQFAYTIELDGYRQRRQEHLQQLTAAAVERVRSSGTEYAIESLSAAERRQVHTLLSAEEYADLETFSRGKEPHRHLVVCLAGKAEA
ncbi:R3H domain-containing nucleic acid-binding protein [Synechococcus sp. PCC 7336]|uniref:Jag family protein n=1 Tax=Synechococcus sp. PCC 7336 TaxID=195250 RepID=UPI0003464230|nr:R3H domain-containing nucleic acid-binding protein [Synechococcus sp. PCC 7336]